jgi:hypothetical protein
MRYVLSRGRIEVVDPFAYTEERGRLGFGGLESGGAAYAWYGGCVSGDAWMYEVWRSSVVGTSIGAGGKAVGSSCVELCVDTEPPGNPYGWEAIDPAVASSVGRGESSGLAIRRPPRDWDRLRSPFMARFVFYFLLTATDDLGTSNGTG